jgi:hypothetical protein
MKKKILFVLFFLQNCVSSTGGIATSNIPFSNKNYKVIKPVDVYSSWISIDFALIGFPIKKPPVTELVNDTLQKENADALVNIHYWNDKIILFFITIHRFGFKAETIKFEEGAVKNETKKTR